MSIRLTHFHSLSWPLRLLSDRDHTDEENGTLAAQLPALTYSSVGGCVDSSRLAVQANPFIHIFPTTREVSLTRVNDSFMFP